ncbi:MAG: glutamate synthase large subunit, partial [Nitrospinota bacterium]
LFAQVTNPPIDPIREELVMSLTNYIGSEGNLLSEDPKDCHRLEITQPILTNLEIEKLRKVDIGDFKTTTLSTLFNLTKGEPGFREALTELCQKASEAVADGFNIAILSDRDTGENMGPLPALLATAAVHHHLIREGVRGKIGLVLETGEAREVHHFALLAGYGAGAINPYLVFDTIQNLQDRSILPKELTLETANNNYIKACNKGLLKVFSKMGISTLQSYMGAQIFEAVGLNNDVIDTYFTNTHSKIGGISLPDIAREAIKRHKAAFPRRPTKAPSLDSGGEYSWRRDGEYHMFNPETISILQKATRTKDFGLFKKYTALLNEKSRSIGSIRGLIEIKTSPEKSIPIEEVEPVSEIVKRFATGAMSYGSISREAHETLAIAMNRLGGRSNTGEGGEDPDRFTVDENGDLRRSAIKQVASGRFGVTSNYLTNADELQIKMAQGAKPGEGGQLPGHKVSETIGKVRHTTPGVGLISPPPHHDIYSIEDLAQLIYDLKNSNPKADVSVKLVSEVGVGVVAAGVSKGKADKVLISGAEGGTGASPMSSIKHAGAPLELGLAETQQTLVLNDLRGRIIVQADGQIKTGRDIAIASMLGADEFGFATSALVVCGCIMMRKCHLNTCPVGIATQNPELRKQYKGKPDYLVNFFTFLAEEVRQIMADLGYRKMDEMTGQSQNLDTREMLAHWKTKNLDLAPLFHKPEVPENISIRHSGEQDHGLEEILDHTLIKKAGPALENRTPVEFKIPIGNKNRTTGTTLGHEITKRYGAEGLPEDTIQIHFTGTAGQSFGAFIPRGLTLSLTGYGNDYVGKGLSGGKIIVQKSPEAGGKAEENIIVGNTLLYGATSGEAYFNGVAGERFAVRNSGASAVVEGLGDHGCEYMTGGKVIVIGPTGRNFAAGMSGGIAYVFDEDGRFNELCNPGMVGLECLTEE